MPRRIGIVTITKGTNYGNKLQNYAIVYLLKKMGYQPYTINDITEKPGNVGDIKVYYLIYLFNTVTSYLVSYKFSLTNAEQKNYVFTNFNCPTAHCGRCKPHFKFCGNTSQTVQSCR